VFVLPWLEFLTGFLTAIVFLCGLAAAITHYLYGGLRLQGGGGPRLGSVARVQLASLAAAFLLLRGVDYWLGRYALTTSQSQRITGLTYTDANATLTARGVLAAIAVVVAVLFVVAAVVERWRMLPLYGVVLLVVSAVVVGGIYPAIVQRFQVTPSQGVLESPYIKKNIDATRAAYGLDEVSVIPYKAATDASSAALKQDAASIPGIRLLDPSIVSDTFKVVEQNKQYYTFPDPLDVDRYTINGTVKDAVVAVRELNLEGVPSAQRSWVNDHLTYTHGYGLVGALGNARQADGQPSFFESGIPAVGSLPDFEPRIYFGEISPEYSIVGGPAGTTARELDYPDDAATNTRQRYTTYAGTGGVPIGSLFNRLLYALKFREQNILLSDGVNDQSRIMYDRNPRDRVEKVAPYLTLDGDPYPSVVNGRVVWILDGYTTSDRYPYSSLRSLSDLTSDSLTVSSSAVVALANDQVNYIRNSVKATVDAYDGSVTLYAWDEADPVLQAWRKVFRNSVKPLSAISGGLMAHLRYPEDLFKVQRTMLAKYHVQDPATFYGAGDFWQVPPDPTGTSGTTSPVQPPYYLSISVPSQPDPRFSLTSTYIPQNGKSQLTGFLAVDSDAGTQNGQRRSDYGQLRLLQLTTDVPGPGQVQNGFTTDPVVGQQLNLFRAGGASKVESGNLLTLPLAGGLLYVQPVYVRSQGETSNPLLQRILVGYNKKIGFSDTLSGALDQVFGTSSSTAPGGSSSPPASSPSPTSSDTVPPASPSASSAAGAQAVLRAALQDAEQAIQDGDAALSRGDFAAYGAAQAKLKVAVAKALTAQQQLGTTTSGATLPATGVPAPTAKPTASPTG
jgi:uncharacterized membrane protein (UPF0182 family)